VIRPNRIVPSRLPVRGFTLLEVLISIVLFGVVLSLLIGGFRFSIRAWDRSEEYAADTANLQAVHRIFRNTLGRAFPITIDEDAGSLFAFSGDENRVRFAAFLPPYPDQAGLYKVQFDIIRVQELYQLRMSRESFRPASFPEEETEETGTTVLIETESPIAFSFFGSPTDGQDPDWQSDWGTGDRYPALVRLGSVNEADDTDGWPEIVTAVEINVDSTCISPELGGICRMAN